MGQPDDPNPIAPKIRGLLQANLAKANVTISDRLLDAVCEMFGYAPRSPLAAELIRQATEKAADEECRLVFPMDFPDPSAHLESIESVTGMTGTVPATVTRPARDVPPFPYPKPAKPPETSSSRHGKPPRFLRMEPAPFNRAVHGELTAWIVLAREDFQAGDIIEVDEIEPNDVGLIGEPRKETDRYFTARVRSVFDWRCVPNLSGGSVLISFFEVSQILMRMPF